MKITGADVLKVVRGEPPAAASMDELVENHMKHGEILARWVGREMRRHSGVVVGCALMWLVLDWISRTDRKARVEVFEDWLRVVRSSWKQNEARERKKQRKAKP